MGKDKEIYKCPTCGQIIEIINGTPVHPMCCSINMELQEPKKEDSSVEKHVPFVEEIDEGVLVKIGEKEDHPMTLKHYIMFIEVLTKKGDLFRVNLKSTDKPQAIFNVKKENIVEVREYCNLHGLWS